MAVVPRGVAGVVWARWGAGTAVALALSGLISGCAGADAPVRERAQHFHAALAAGDAASACADLAEEARRSLESDEGTSCRDAIIGLGIPAVDDGGAVRRYGSLAQVRHDDETTFLSRYDDGWRVIAAGCKPGTGDQPYDCMVEVG